MNVKEMVEKALAGASERHLEEIVAHGIHNISNEFLGDNEEEYEEFASEFEKQAKAMLAEIEYEKYA